MRLDKFLAGASIGTKKIIHNYIIEGKVTVNDQIKLDPAAEVEENTDRIKCLGKEVVSFGKKYYMFHKPGGCITARKDMVNRTVFDYIDVDHMEGLFPVGRLDKDTEGLLLLTNDGEFSHSLMHPDKHVEKTYYFWAFGSLDSENRKILETGISIGEDEAMAKAIKIEVEEQGMYQELKNKMNAVNIKDINKNPDTQRVVSGYITICEGRKHQVKRMLKAVGCYVAYLKRVSIGGLMLDESLKPGQYRELSQMEIEALTIDSAK